MSYPQGQQLRVDPTRITTPILEIRPGQPTFIPNIVVPAQIMPYFQAIVSFVQMEIEMKATQSAIRVHAHNLVSMNEFHTAEFHELVELVTKYVHVQMSYGRQWTDITVCMQNVIPHLVGVWSAAQVQIFPGLMQYLQPEQQQMAMDAVRLMGDVVTEINRAEQGHFYQGAQHNRQMPGGPQPGFLGGGSAQGNAQGYGNMAQANQPYGQNNGGGWAAAAQLQNGHRGIYTIPAGQQRGHLSPFRSGNAMTPQPQEERIILGRGAKSASDRMTSQLLQQHGIDPNPPPNAMELAYSRAQSNAEKSAPSQEGNPYYNANKEQPNTQPTNPVKAWRANKTAASAADVPWDETVLRTPQQETTQPAEVKTQSYVVGVAEQQVKASQWKPSVHQPYHPAWSASKHKCVYSKLDDGTVVAVILNKTESEQAMKEAEHAIGVRSLVAAAFTRNDQNQVVKQASADQEVLAIEYPKQEIELINNDDVLIELSDRVPAVTGLLMGMMSGFINSKHQAWHSTTWIADPIIASSKDVVEYLNMLTERAAECATFAQLHEVLLQMNSPDELVLRQRINQVMTRAINDVLAFTISPSVYIDDFEADGDTIIAQITKSKGERLGGVIASAEQQLIKSNLRALNADGWSTMSESIRLGLAGEYSWNGSMTFLACKVTHTHLQYTAAELDLAMPRRRAALLTEEKTPVLCAVAEEIMREDDPVVAEYARHYIVTSDGVVLLVSRGLINPEAMLVRIVD